MKRQLRAAISLIAISVVSISVAACGGGEGGGGGGGNDSTGSDDSLTVGVSLITPSNPLFTSIRDGMEEEAETRGVTLDLVFATSVEEQTNQLNAFVTKQVDAVIASPLDASALVPAYQAVRSAGIPILSIANKVDDQHEDAYIGPDLQEAARQTMERLIEGIGGSGDIVAITGPPEIAFVQLQEAGWEEALDGHADVRTLATYVDPDLSTALALDLANTAFSSYPEVSAIINSTDAIALGAITAMQSHGIPEDQVFIAGWDATPAGIEAVQNGTYDLTMSLKPRSWGALALETAINWIAGEKPSEHVVDTPILFIDASNVDSLSDSDIN